MTARVFLIFFGLVMFTPNGVADSEVEAFNPCPNDLEWASSLDAQRKPPFWLLANSAINFYFSRIDFDGNPLEDDDLMELFWLLSIHTYQGAHYSEDISILFLNLKTMPVIKENYPEEIIDEISQCVLGNKNEDCAKLAFDRGYIPSLEALLKHDYVYETVRPFRDWCELTTLNLHD